MYRTFRVGESSTLESHRVQERENLQGLLENLRL